MRLWIYPALLAFALAAASAESTEDDTFLGFGGDDDWWSSEDADILKGLLQENSDEVENKNTNISANDYSTEDDDSNSLAEDEEPVLKEDDTKTLEEIEKFRIDLDGLDDTPAKDAEVVDLFGDYQFEDNRSDPKSDVSEDTDFNDDTVLFAVDDSQVLPNQAVLDETRNILEEDKDSVFDVSNVESEKVVKNEDFDENDADDRVEDSAEEEINVEPKVLIPDDDQQAIFDETEQILNEGNDNNFSEVKQKNELGEQENIAVDQSNAKSIDFLDSKDKVDVDNDAIFDETNVILNEDDGNGLLDNVQGGMEPEIEDSVKETEPLFEENENKAIFDETFQILNGDSDEKLDMQQENYKKNEASDDIDKWLDEARDMMGKDAEDEDEDLSDSMTMDEYLAELDTLGKGIEELMKNVTELEKKLEDESAVDENKDVDSIFDRVDADNLDDLEHLFDTWDKLTKDMNDDEIMDKPIEDFDPDYLKDLFDTWDRLNLDVNEDDSKSDDNVLDYEAKHGKPFREDVVLLQRENMNDDDNINNETSEEDDSDDSESQSVEIKQMMYSNDALLANDSEPSNKNSEKDDTANEDEPLTTKVEDLTPEQYNQLMKQFVQVHADDLDTQSENFARNIATSYRHLNAEEALIITSPGYPTPYPTNNIVDWVIDGEGSGIELNITDFAVNGAVGDYVLIKPGGIDASGTEGIILSYTLAEPRFFRFVSVDRMFIRFESKGGLAFSRGFSFSLRNIVPPQGEPEVEPTPAPPPPTPPATFTVALGGLTAQSFVNVKEEFRQIIAAMATMYINANQIEFGSTNISEVTQLTNVAICNVNWPEFETCVEVKFGVPLTLGDEAATRLNENDLRAMWYTYVYRDPFATRLRRLGIEEFSTPSDGRMLAVWLVVGATVLISIAILAAALWRFNSGKYTRMASFSDTSSVNEKRGLDLYPTPHQALPPLYAEPEFKWDEPKFEDDARIDMGGFPNRSFVADELLDIDSDDEVVIRERNSIRPSDIYKV